MKSRIFALMSISAFIYSPGAYADESVIKTSEAVASYKTMSIEDVNNGVERGIFCTDIKGLVNSQGAVIEHNGKFYRCVKSYGENLSENKNLVWVEVIHKEGNLVIAD